MSIKAPQIFKCRITFDIRVAVSDVVGIMVEDLVSPNASSQSWNSSGRVHNPKHVPFLSAVPTASNSDTKQTPDFGNEDSRKLKSQQLSEPLQTEELSASGDQSQTLTSAESLTINLTSLNTNTLGQQNYQERNSEDCSDDNMSSSDGVYLRSNDIQPSLFRNSMIEPISSQTSAENMHHRHRGYTDGGNIRGNTTSTFQSLLINNENGVTLPPYLTNCNESFASHVLSNDATANLPALSAHINLSNLQKSISDTKLDSPTEKDVSSDGMASSGTASNLKERSVLNKSLKKESLRQQKKFYRQEKKKAAQEIMLALNDPSVEMMANFLKVRTTLKSWVKLYCVLKPGLLVLYRSQKTNKSSQWVGTVLLNCCNLIERPSKKDGFCFKIFHPLEQSIWALKGPHGESTSLMGLNLPSCYLIFRALSDSDGKCWMDHMELTIKVGPAKIKGSLTG